MNQDFPCRLAAGLALFESEMNRLEADHFNEYDEMHVRAVVPYELAKPVQAMLESRNSMKDGDYLKDELDQLYRACVSRWRDL